MLNPWRNRREKLDAIANRLEQLLSQSENPRAEMIAIEKMLSDADLANWSVPLGTTPMQFAQTMIAENPQLYDVIDETRTEFRPELIETAEELINHIVPSEADHG